MSPRIYFISQDRRRPCRIKNDTRPLSHYSAGRVIEEETGRRRHRLQPPKSTPIKLGINRHCRHTDMQSFIRGARAVVSKLRPKPKNGLRKSARMLSSGGPGAIPSPVSSYNEWDPLEEIIVGTAEGMRVPFLHPNLKVS